MNGLDFEGREPRSRSLQGQNLSECGGIHIDVWVSKYHLVLVCFWF